MFAADVAVVGGAGGFVLAGWCDCGDYLSCWFVGSGDCGLSAPGWLGFSWRRRCGGVAAGVEFVGCGNELRWK